MATVTGGRPNGGVVTWCMAQSVQSSFSHALYSVAANQAGNQKSGAVQTLIMSGIANSRHIAWHQAKPD